MNRLVLRDPVAGSLLLIVFCATIGLGIRPVSQPEGPPAAHSSPEQRAPRAGRAWAERPATGAPVSRAPMTPLVSSADLTPQGVETEIARALDDAERGLSDLLTVSERGALRSKIEALVVDAVLGGSANPIQAEIRAALGKERTRAWRAKSVTNRRERAVSRKAAAVHHLVRALAAGDEQLDAIERAVEISFAEEAEALSALLNYDNLSDGLQRLNGGPSEVSEVLGQVRRSALVRELRGTLSEAQIGQLVQHGQVR